MRGPIDSEDKQNQGEWHQAALDRVKKAEADKKDITDKPESRSDDEENALKRYRPSLKKGPFFTSKRKKIAAFISGIGVITFVIAGVMGILSGPLQFLQLANTVDELYNGFQFVSEQRGTSLLRWMRNSNAPERRRLGYTANKVVDSVERKLARDGIQIEKRNGYMQRIIVNGETIDVSNLRNSQRRAEFRNVLRELGYGKASVALMSRPIFTRYGIDLRPLGNVKRSANESLRDYYQKLRQDKDQRIKVGVLNHASMLDELERKIESGEELTPREQELYDSLRQNADVITETTDDVKKAYDSEVTQTEKTKAAGEAMRSKLRGGGSAIIVLGMAACTMRQIGTGSVAGEYLNQVLPLIRHAEDARSIASQLQSGESVTMDELGFNAQRFDNPETGSWTSSSLVKSQYGELGGEPPPTNVSVGELSNNSNWVKISDSLSQVDNWSPVSLDDLCSAMGNIIVQGVITTIEWGAVFFSGGVWAGVIAGAKATAGLLGEFLISAEASSIVAAAAGDIVPSMIDGPDYGAAVMTGGYLSSNMLMMEHGGKTLEPAESLELAYFLEKESAYEKENMSIASKYFDLANPKTVAGAFALSSYSFDFQNDFLKNPGGLIQYALSNVMSPFTDRVFAQAPSERFFDIKQIGFTVGELNSDIANEDPFENETKLLEMADSRNMSIQQLQEECIPKMPTPPINQSSSFVIDNSDYLNPDDSDCVNKYGSEMMLRLRFYTFDLKLLNSYGCISGVRESCDSLGLSFSSTNDSSSTVAGSTIVGDPIADSTNIACAEGTKDIGIFDAYVKGDKVPSRMCSITGFESKSSSNSYMPEADGYVVVNSRVSGAVQSMYKTALTDGVTLVSNSSFRSHQHQTDLYANCVEKTTCIPGTHVARPGYSNHQNGTAIDFYLVSGSTSGASCETRAKDPGNSMWDWLEANARNFGYYQYVNEAWHWDPLYVGTSRC